MLTLCSLPFTIRGADGDGNVTLQMHAKMSMNDQQDAVKNYRDNLVPAIFIVTQKVYSELFRLVLSNNSLSAGDKQFDIETKLSNNLTLITDYGPFSTQNNFSDWWEGRYSFNLLRRARNHMVHDQYKFDGSKLNVKDNSGILIDWTTSEVIRFTTDVLTISKNIK